MYLTSKSTTVQSPCCSQGAHILLVTNATLNLSVLTSIHFLYLIKIYVQKRHSVYISNPNILLNPFSDARFAFNSGFELCSLFQVIEFIRMDTHDTADNENCRNRRLNCKSRSGGEKTSNLKWLHFGKPRCFEDLVFKKWPCNFSQCWDDLSEFLTNQTESEKHTLYIYRTGVRLLE